MATSGTGYGNNLSGNFYFTNWQLAGQDIAGNYSTINWQSYWHFQNSDHQIDDGYTKFADIMRWQNSGRVYNYSGNFGTRDLYIAGGSFTVGHNTDGTKWMQASGAATGLGRGRSEYITGWDLPTIPRHGNITGYSGNITDETVNPWIEFNNPAGGATQVWLELPNINGTRYAQRNGVGSRYTWTLTNAEQDAIRVAMANAASTTIRYKYANNVGGSWVERAWDATITIVNGNPVFTADQVTYKDTDAAVVAITGSNQLIVQNKSDLNVTFTAAAALKSATIVSYKITFGTNVQTKTAASTIDYNAVDLNDTTPVVVEVTDSRGLKTSVSKNVTIKPWSPPRAVITAGRVNNYEDSTNVKADVTIDSVDGHNSIQGISLKYKKTTDSTWTTTTMTSGTVKNISISKLYEWNIQIIITDKFGTTTYNATVSKGIPIMFIDNAKLSVGIGMFPTGSATLEVADSYLVPIMKKVHPVGRIVMSTDPVNPGTLPELAGTTWAAWGTGRVPVGFDSGQTEFNTVEKTSGAKTHTLTTGEMPYHNHPTASPGWAGPGFATNIGTGGSNFKADTATGYAGGGGAHNNLQPSIVCYFWKRTA